MTLNLPIVRVARTSSFLVAHTGNVRSIIARRRIHLMRPWCWHLLEATSTHQETADPKQGQGPSNGRTLLLLSFRASLALSDHHGAAGGVWGGAIGFALMITSSYHE